MQTKKLVATACAVAVTLRACAPVTGSRQGDGTILGAGAGAVIGGLVTSRLGAGGQIAGVVGGAIIGGLVGGAIGSSLDEQERQQLALMTQQTLTTGSVRTDTSPRSGTRISTRVVKRPSADPVQTAQVCRSVEQKIVMPDGTEKTETVNGCRGPNGWQTT